MSSKRLVVGNWKMNPPTLAEAKRIARVTRRVAAELKHTDVVACPPYVYIPAMISKKHPELMRVGAQTVSVHEAGAHTGEVSAAMIKDVGAEYVIVGHSEERAAGDTDADVAKRVQAALLAGLKPIVCVGESVRDDAGAYLETLKNQIKNSFADVPKNQAKNITLAYEPVWAIGAKEAMVPAQVYEMSLFVKKSFSDVFGHDPAMKVRVLYGGSVNFRNAADIISIGKVDGLLVGRESVSVVGFPDLLRAVDSVS
ncbi:MAG: triose-phosphate isomerase [Patescibacteria group bacterium]